MNDKELERISQTCRQLIEQVGSVYVGHPELLTKLLAAALANGHVLFEDFPGLGKTLLAKVFARVIGCQFARIQFTPDLLPADILGTKIWRQESSSFEFIKGPVFTNVLLADEINRAPPKTQSALLEAMEERQVTIDGETYQLQPPFFVLATQNPIEMEGTYPLPEAQMDRFLLRLSAGYLRNSQEEAAILSRRVSWRKDDPSSDVRPLLSPTEFRRLQELTEEVYVDRSILEYIIELVRHTRQHPRVEIGSSPRGALALLRASRALALINGRDFVTPDDVKFLATDALAHRVILKLEEAVEGTKEEKVVEEVLQEVPPPLKGEGRR